MTTRERLRWLDDNNIELLQEEDELRQLLAHLEAERARGLRWPPKTLVEIGCWEGGSLFVLAGLLAPGATIIGIDPSPDDKQREKIMTVVRELVKQGFDAHCLRRMSYKAQKTVRDLLAVHKHTAIEYLHIDGSHYYKDVKADFEMYAPLVPIGGVIQLHDVTNVYPKTHKHAGKKYGTNTYWHKIIPNYPRHAALAAKVVTKHVGRTPGIGVIVV